MLFVVRSEPALYLALSSMFTDSTVDVLDASPFRVDVEA